MQEFATGTIWIKKIPLRFFGLQSCFGLQIGRPMTAIRLGDGGLSIHSPTTLDAKTREEIDALGPVRFIVAPRISDRRSDAAAARASDRPDKKWGDVPLTSPQVSGRTYTTRYAVLSYNHWWRHRYCI